MTTIRRYDNELPVSTPFDPLDDVLNWIRGLGSAGYASDILRHVHGFKSQHEIRESSRAMAMYSANACGLAEQAMHGPAETAFLPLYYSILNLSKIYVVLSGRRRLLSANQYHGASYNPSRKASRSLLTEEITLWKRGVLGLFYQALTGAPWTFKKHILSMRNAYPYVLGTQFEYEQAFNSPSPIQTVDVRLLKHRDKNDYDLRIKTEPSRHPNGDKRSHLKLLSGFSRDGKDESVFVLSTRSQPDEARARSVLLSGFRRFLLYEYDYRLGQVGLCTPLSNKTLLLPEELPIWLVFFHLSNVVRYNPEFLSRLMGLPSWPMLLALRKHAFFKFCLLFWSFLRQANVSLGA